MLIFIKSWVTPIEEAAAKRDELVEVQKAYRIENIKEVSSNISQGKVSLLHLISYRRKAVFFPVRLKRGG